jgi:surface polysaccharide O-acyltransferase-like enzyme
LGDKLYESRAEQSRADISVLRITATMAVLFHHTCSTVSDNPELFSFSQKQNFILQTGVLFSVWAVPVFLMISGALLLKPHKVISVEMCLTKYVKRAILALFIFGIPFSCLEILMNSKRLSLSIFPQAVLNVINGESWDHLWYLYALIGIYLFLPVLKAFTDTCTRKTLKYILIVLFVINLCFPMINDILGISIAFEIPVKSTSVFYFLLGRYLDENIPAFLQNKKRNLMAAVVILAAVSFICGFAGFYSFLYHIRRNSPIIALTAVFIFSAVRGVHFPKIRTEFLWKIDRLCFGVYLVHPVFIHFLYKFLKITPLSFGKVWGVFLIVFWMFFILCSFIASWVMSLIPPLKKYIL